MGLGAEDLVEEEQAEGGNMKSQQFEKLKNKWVARHQNFSKILYEKHKDAVDWAVTNLPEKHRIISGALSGLMLMGIPASGSSIQHATFAGQQNTDSTTGDQPLVNTLSKIVPSEMRTLTSEEEQMIGGILTDHYGFRVIPDIGGKRLDRTYGLIGAEQHLPRYPGDTIFNHADSTSDWDMFGQSGITPGLGAWGYFASSADQMTEKDKIREKYYIAVQTFLAPDFNNHVAEYRDFFKYRKMLVVNPKTGQAVVADIADAGPSPWTGKHLGGSPEVMYILGLADGPRKGAVLYYFIDDPKDVVPLGPVKSIQSLI